jgi:cation diffusion facilitator CzcD-associated flavoprotein CzcO
MRIVIVGAGFSGIATAIALRKAGFEDFTIFERADDLGGVWHQNTYPGAACDVPSALYSLSYAQEKDWSQPCSSREEIHAYLHRVAREQDVFDRIRTSTGIASAAWDGEALRWTLQTEAGERLEADALVLACGQLSRPSWPSIEGSEDFAGHSFHSAEWDHAYDLSGKRIAVIGTGASAIQFVPPIVEQAARVDVYQRTPPYILPRRNPHYPTWMRTLFRHVPGVQALRRASIFLLLETLVAGLIRVPALGWVVRTVSTTFMRMQVRDPELRRKIWPNYRFGCKRILFSSYYLKALQRPNVDLVTDRIARITPAGVETADGVEREVDCLIYGTGFRTRDFVVPMEVAGRDGRDLQEAWSGGAEAHLGITVAGYPNMFLIYGPNTNLGIGSILVMLEAQAGYVADALRTLRARGVAALDLRPEVQASSSADVQERLRGGVWTQCDSWYTDDETGRVINNWPGFMAEYVRATRHVDPAEYVLLERRREPVAA